MKRNVGILIVLLAALAVMLVVGIRHKAGTPGSMLAAPGPAKGNLAPEFSLTDLKTGGKVQLADYRGKAVLLNFWATWCGPCREEIPWLVDLQKQYGPQGLQIVGVAMDDADKETIVSFAGKMGVNYPVLQGTEKAGDAYGGVEALPTTFYIGRDGKITDSMRGAPSRSFIERQIQAALQTSGSASAGSR